MSGPHYISMADLEAYRGQGSGKARRGKLRFYCPLHGSDKQKSLVLRPSTGNFRCYSCGAWGYLEEKKEEWVAQQKSLNGTRQQWEQKGKPASTKALKATVKPEVPLEHQPHLEGLLAEFQVALPGSWGEEYLAKRGIPLELAQAYGVGYAANGKWPHKNKNGKLVMQWKWGRLVFPHHTPEEHLVNLYGRAVGASEKVPKEARHSHLSGLPKGAFNVKGMSKEGCFICEGPFDAISLLGAGFEAAAIFGVDGLRWEWLQASRTVFCFDNDETGRKKALALGWKAKLQKGKKISFYPEEAYCGKNDINELWVDYGFFPVVWNGENLEMVNEDVEERAAILEFEAGLAREKAEAMARKAIGEV